MLDCVKLKNGLKIYLYNDPNKHSVYINLIVKFGGKDSSIYLGNKKIKNKSGVAHFLEHYSLEHNKYGNLMEIFSNKGIRSNGITSLDRTTYYVDTVNSNIKEELTLLIDGIHNPVFSKESIEKVRGPILAEKRRSLDNKYASLYNTNISSILKQGIFKSILGDLRDISSINQKDLENAFKAYYRPNNEVLIIGGNFNKQKTIKIIEELYSNIQFSKLITKEIKYKNINKVNSELTILSDDVNIEKSIITYKIPISNLSNQEKIELDNYMFYFLRSNFGITSKLNNELIKNKIIIGNLSFFSNYIDDSFIISIDANTLSYELFNKYITNYIKNKSFYFDEDLFNMYKKNTIIDYIIRKDNIHKMIDPLIENIIIINYPYLDDINDINKLTFKEYKKTISNLNFSTYSISVLKRNS